MSESPFYCKNIILKTNEHRGERGTREQKKTDITTREKRLLDKNKIFKKKHYLYRYKKNKVPKLNIYEKGD